MTVHGVKLPDVGEGVAEAELVDWHVAIGDHVTTESVLAEVLTDKATVEISSPVAGVVVALHGEPGDLLAVGADLVGIELDGAAPTPMPPPPPARPAIHDQPAPAAAPAPAPAPASLVAGPRVTAAPAVRARARELGIDLSAVAGTGPDGRVVHADLDRQLLGGGVPIAPPSAMRAGGTTVEPVRGLRRRIAERLSAAWTEIPHITYVEAVDVTELEALRGELNDGERADGDRLTVLPFLALAIVVALRDQPRLNAHYDAAAESLTLHDAVHVGIATQTGDGLMVPVVRDADARGLWDLAREITRVAGAARDGRASRDELGGSTITITSLGALGGLMTTPIINQPEVAIVGVNKIETRPVWHGDRFEPRQVMNLSSSFDHRIVDGWDAAVFVQRIRTLLEMPALLFVDAPRAPTPR